MIVSEFFSLYNVSSKLPFAITSTTMYAPPWDWYKPKNCTILGCTSVLNNKNGINKLHFLSSLLVFFALDILQHLCFLRKFVKMFSIFQFFQSNCCLIIPQSLVHLSKVTCVKKYSFQSSFEHRRQYVPRENPGGKTDFFLGCFLSG